MAEYKGRHVKITLDNGHEFEGFVHSTDEITSKLTLEKVTDCNTNTRIKGLQHFFAYEMENIEALEDQIQPKTPENDKIIQDRREDGPKVIYSKSMPSHLRAMETFHAPKRMLKTMSSVDDEKGEKTKSALKSSDYDSSSDQDVGQSDDNNIIINKIDQKFDQAIHHITRYGVIGVAMEGVCIGRSGTLCWLQIGTNDHTFLFDVLTMGSECFESGLKEILEDMNILKVMHDCRLPSDLLHHQYQVSLVNVFDTQVADVFVYRLYHGNDWPRYVQGLPACLFEHLNLAQEQIHNMKVRQSLKKEDQEVWKERPLSKSLLDAAAKNVKHLRELRIVLTEKMMAEYVAGVDVYLSHVKNASKDDARKHQANPQLLPLGFRDLHSVMMTSRDFYYMNREKKLPKDSAGFRENCTGVGDPELIFSHDSIWHTGSKVQGSAYFNQYQSLMSKKKEDAASHEASKTLSPTTDKIPETSDKTQDSADKVTVSDTSGAPLSEETSAQGSENQDSSDRIRESGKVNEFVNSQNLELSTAANPLDSSDGCIMSAGRKMRELMSKDKFFNTGCDTLENFEVRPAGTWQVSGRRKKKGTEKVVPDLPVIQTPEKVLSDSRTKFSEDTFSESEAESQGRFSSSSLAVNPSSLDSKVFNSEQKSPGSRTENLELSPSNSVPVVRSEYSEHSNSWSRAGISGSSPSAVRSDNSDVLSPGCSTEISEHSPCRSQVNNLPSHADIHIKNHVEMLPQSDSESIQSGILTPSLVASLGRGRGVTFSPRVNNGIHAADLHQGNIPFACVESKIRRPGQATGQNKSISQENTWGTLIQKASSPDNNDTKMTEKVSPILKLNTGLSNSNGKLTNLRLILDAVQNSKQ